VFIGGEILKSAVRVFDANVFGCVRGSGELINGLGEQSGDDRPQVPGRTLGLFAYFVPQCVGSAVSQEGVDQCVGHGFRVGHV
jgi:hypothetical protein